jgi:hypothetical protein
MRVLRDVRLACAWREGHLPTEVLDPFDLLHALSPFERFSTAPRSAGPLFGNDPWGFVIQATALPDSLHPAHHATDKDGRLPILHRQTPSCRCIRCVVGVVQGGTGSWVVRCVLTTRLDPPQPASATSEATTTTLATSRHHGRVIFQEGHRSTGSRAYALGWASVPERPLSGLGRISRLVGGHAPRRPTRRAQLECVRAEWPRMGWCIRSVGGDP